MSNTKMRRLSMHADSVITQLGLTKCKNIIVGGGSVRGISGGERKRTPQPAEKIVSTLLKLVKGGRSVVMTMHQPSGKIYNMFHKVFLRSDGSPMYFGKGAAAMDYFSSIGYTESSPILHESYRLPFESFQW
ncbi:hypothetical protein IFM89_022749 [Coptis chinensis]|uniref:ABC transporter family G domain-containing protein n=1 Tax=Coptis chinensis TaxID=261450 RepID=A0A835I4J9_9MAGN|nr:hypothetical protein IFM89_022749 [Coptis chinensis]